MKLSQIEKRIPQTLTNSKDIIQTHREYARRSNRARSRRGQENEAWALYKKKSSRESWGDLSGHRYIICPKPPYPAEKILNFLAARWSGPAASASIFSVCLDYILRVCQSLWDSFLYLGKLHWFLYLLLSYFYDPGMFIFRWSSNFQEKVVLNESMSAKMAPRVFYLVYYYCR